MLPQEDTTQEIRFQYLSTISQDDVNGLLYIRHVSQTAHGDCKLRIKLPRNIRYPPIGTGNSESNLLSTTTQQPAQLVQHVLGVSGRTRGSRTTGDLFPREANTSTF